MYLQAAFATRNLVSFTTGVPHFFDPRHLLLYGHSLFWLLIGA